MEALAGASSVISVVSVAIQLAESIHSLVQFWRSVENAPEDINALVHDLELLAQVLDRSNKLNHLVNNHYVDNALRNCQRKVLQLRSTIERASLQLKSSNQYKRRYAAVKVTLKRQELDLIQRAIQDAKLTLLVAQSSSIQELILSNSSVQKQAFATLQSSTFNIQQQSTTVKIQSPTMQLPYLGSEENESLSLQAGNRIPKKHAPQVSCQEVLPNDMPFTTDVTESTRKCFIWSFRPPAGRVLGIKERWYTSLSTPLINVSAHTFRLQVTALKSSGIEEATSKEATCVLYPSQWLQQLGLTRGLQIASGYKVGWCSIQPFRAISPDSLIFEFCREGNLAGVRSLLKRGEASPHDRDPMGWTPLRVAVNASQLEIVEFLLQEGADPHARDWRHNHQPIEWVFDAAGADIEPKMSLLRVLQKYRREDYDDQALRFLLGRAFMNYRLHRDINLSMQQRWDAILQILTLMMPNFPPESDDRIHILQAAMTFYCLKEVLHKVLNSIPGNLDRIPSGTMLLHQAMLKRFLFRDPYSMKLLVQKTRDLHLCATDGYWSSTPHTPTMYALYDQEHFIAWRNLLRELGYDIQEFVRQELEKGLLGSQGWNETSLLYIFQETFPADPLTGPLVIGFPSCERCSQPGAGFSARPMIDLKWRRKLRKIRQNSYLYKMKREPVEGFCSLDITISTVTSESRDAPLKVSTEDYEQDHKLPYRMVCSDPCLDGVCVAWVYENDLLKEPELLPYPYEPLRCFNTESEEEMEKREEDSPTYNMPGSFKE